MNYKEKIISILTNKELTLEQQQQLETIFPELKESEDERVRNEIIAFVMQSIHRGGGTPIPEEQETKWIAWLEKQRQEPKFKVGDWIISNNKKSIYQVIEVKRGIYVIRDNANNHEYHIGIEECEKTGRLWNISDAKDGDVLVYGDNPNDYHVEVIMIFKSSRSKHSAFTHFHIFDNEFRTDDWCDCSDNAHPATKEQRNTLMKAMADAGYTFDFEKKELKKLGQPEVTKISDKVKDSDWSEEDEKMLNDAIVAVYAAAYHTYNDRQKIENWLKSIKQRITNN